MSKPLTPPCAAAPHTRALLVALAALAACVAPQYAAAQTRLPVTQLPIRGDVIEMSWTTEQQPLRMRARDGSEVDLQLAFNFESIELGPVTHDRLVPGAFVSVAAAPGAGGSLRALAVVLHFHDLSESSEGQQAWDLAPASTLIHATIGGIDAQRTSRTLTLRYAGGEKTVVVGDDVPVAAMLGGGHIRMSPGAHVFITATRQRDGTLTAGRIYYGKDGYTPPL